MKTIDQNNIQTSDSWLENGLDEFGKVENFTIGLDKLVTLCESKTLEYISREMRKKINKTPCEFMNELRLEYAAKQLVETNKQIISISLDSGYNSLSYFNRIFKKEFGMTPNQYRRGK